MFCFVLFIYFYFFDYLLVWLRLGDPFVFQNPREICASHSPGRIPGCAYTTGSLGQISISFTIPSGSLSLPSRVQAYTLFVVICYIHLVYNRSFRLYHHITYTCYFVASYLFLLQPSLSLWRCFGLLLEEIHFLCPSLLVWDFARLSFEISIRLGGCFFPHFCFLVLLILVFFMLFLVAVVRLFFFLLFFMHYYYYYYYYYYYLVHSIKKMNFTIKRLTFHPGRKKLLSV